MSRVNELKSAVKPSSQASRPMQVREQLERLYREIGISAVASAAHMASLKPEKPVIVHELPAILRDDSIAA